MESMDKNDHLFTCGFNLAHRERLIREFIQQDECRLLCVHPAILTAKTTVTYAALRKESRRNFINAIDRDRKSDMGYAERRMQRKPRLLVELSGVFWVRAATR
jgi:hypothetical protein